MLILTRKIDQGITLETSDGPVNVIICGIDESNRVKLGIIAPKAVAVVRNELAARSGG